MTIMIGVRRKNSFCTRLLLILCLAWVANSELYPFGTGNGDTTLRKENDYAERVTLDRAFPFGGKYHNVLYIGDNGVISFEDAIYVESTDAKFRNLPIYYDADEDGVVEDPDAIFPFWADVDISGDGGNLYYRVSTSTSTLDQATTDVRSYFRSNVNFQAQVVIVVTWDQVSFYNQAGDQDPRNTFQAVLIHDGQESFVLLNYGDINWVVGSLMQGDDNTGLYGSSKIGIAIVGFLMSDGEIYEVFDYDQDTLQALPTDSNVEVDGVYAYKVDGSSIIDPVCKTGPGAELSITPARGGMMGGERIYLYGPCWAVEQVQTCVFSHGGEIIQEVNATVLNTNEAYCVPDPFFLVGEVTIAVVKAGDELATSPSTIYSLLESGRLTPTITRMNSDSSNWDMTDNPLTITWQPDQESFGSSDSALSINVLAYREDNPGPRWETVYLITNSTADDGSHTFTPTAQPEVTEDNAFGVIRITGNANGRERVLWSDIHPLGYLLEQSYQDDPVLWATDKCNEWLTADDSKGPFIENLPACPCTLDQATQDVGTFVTDPACNTLSTEANCAENEGAIYCVLSAYASRITMSGTKCCYDENNLLMHSGDTRYAGMAGRSHIRGASPYRQRNLVPELSHWSNDVIAKHFCCGWASEKECFEYTKVRPTTDCVAYEPPTIALSFGDPHYITMDRTNFTFNGLGEYTLLRYAMSGTKTGPFDFELQGRQIKTLDSSGREVDVTQLSSVAMQDSGSDTIFVEASASSGMDVYRRGTEDNAEWQSVYFSQQTFTDLQGCAVGVTEFQLDVEIHGVVVMFKETGIGVAVNYHDGMLAVQPILPSTIDSEHLSGLLGNMDGDPSNDMEARNSNTPLEDPTDEEIFQFGQSWEIEADYTLFRYVSNRDHSHYHNTSFVPRMNVALPTLYPPCNDVYQCLFDYEVSNDDGDLALATLDAYEDFESSSENIRKIDACPYLITPYNGTKSYSSDSNKYFEGAEVSFTCGENLLMVGSSFKRCEYDMEVGSLVWTGSEGDNECIESTCGVLDTPANGSIALSEDGSTAYFACQDGFTLSGAMQSVCQEGVWSSAAPTCIVGNEVNVVGIAVGVTFAVIIVILLVVLGILYYNKSKKKKSNYRGYGGKSKKPKSTDDRDAELAEPLNKKPTDVRASTRSSSSQKSSEGNTGPSAQIYKPTAISQSSVKYNSGGKGSQKPSSKPPEPVKKNMNPEPKPAEPKPVQPKPVNEEIPIAKETAKTENSAPPPVAKKPKTPDTLRKDPNPYPSSDTGSYAGSTAPSSTYRTPSRDEADVVKGTGLLQNTNITGTGGWI
ncbi:sushi domain-containing protein 2-like isoform X2 [Lytechinus variegatus]|uniref:sushi domain-containing protein 2-like isoform X2 n=1 Tax=Lytechinus variegatus TaxID=7654 RepID=UPI001BB2C1D3|nr:sushi domain-containing protein 2-like isoform X2 [Lytechinus variegatus]